MAESIAHKKVYGMTTCYRLSASHWHWNLTWMGSLTSRMTDRKVVLFALWQDSKIDARIYPSIQEEQLQE